MTLFPSPKRAALVISTYNNPRFLGLCLKSFSNQSVDKFDIFIADDGSTDETRKKIEEMRPLFSCKIQHFWQPDDGFRKSAIHNEVFRHIKDYPITICVDGDTIAHYRFIEDHLKAHRRISRGFFMGRRVELGPWISKQLEENMICEFNQGLSMKLLASGLMMDSKAIFRAVRVENGFFQALFKRDHVSDLLGSNFSVTTDLLFEVNGYNEDFTTYWGEDGDLFIRLRNSGSQILGIKSFAIQYHIDHPRRHATSEAQEQYQQMLKNRDYRRCANGIVKDALQS